MTSTLFLYCWALCKCKQGIPWHWCYVTLIVVVMWYGLNECIDVPQAINVLWIFIGKFESPMFNSYTNQHALKIKELHGGVCGNNNQITFRISDVNLFNSLAPGKFEWNFRSLIFQIISVIDGWGISCEVAHRWMSLDITDDKSTMVQVMAWCQCWPRSPSPYGITRPRSLLTSVIKSYRISFTMDTLTANMQPHENAIWVLDKFCDTPVLWNTLDKCINSQ